MPGTGDKALGWLLTIYVIYYMHEIKCCVRTRTRWRVSGVLLGKRTRFLTAKYMCISEQLLFVIIINYPMQHIS